MSDLPTTSRNLGPLTQTSGRTLTADSGPDWLSSSWWQQLQPGSWRNHGFVLETAETRAGRRVALHEYPYRDSIWAEDLGKLPRRFQFHAYIVGDDVYQQRDALVAACEQPGPGTLVHPTFGTVECVLLEFGAVDHRDRGRYIELAFSFVLAGDLLFPQAVQSTGAAVEGAADELDEASDDDIETVEAIPTTAGRGMTGWGNMAISAVNDPARAFGAVAGLQGFFGRFASGRRSGVQAATATVQSLLNDATRTRAAVLTAVDKLNTAMGAF